MRLNMKKIFYTLFCILSNFTIYDFTSAQSTSITTPKQTAEFVNSRIFFNHLGSNWICLLEKDGFLEFSPRKLLEIEVSNFLNILAENLESYISITNTGEMSGKWIWSDFNPNTSLVSFATSPTAEPSSITPIVEQKLSEYQFILDRKHEDIIAIDFFVKKYRIKLVNTGTNSEPIYIKSVQILSIEQHKSCTLKK